MKKKLILAISFVLVFLVFVGGSFAYAAQGGAEVLKIPGTGESERSKPDIPDFEFIKEPTAAERAAFIADFNKLVRMKEASDIQFEAALAELDAQYADGELTKADMLEYVKERSKIVFEWRMADVNYGYLFDELYDQHGVVPFIMPKPVGPYFPYKPGGKCCCGCCCVSGGGLLLLADNIE